MKRSNIFKKHFINKPCVVCGNSGEGDHILNYKGWKSRDVVKNGWALCRSHHTEKGSIGLFSFVENYDLSNQLILRGFWFCPVFNKWRHDEF